MPHSVHILIELKNPAIFSASGASAGLHRTHQIIPGAQLLGVAAREFDWKDSGEGFKLFRSGAVRFGNGYPVNDAGKVCYPVPRSLHASKKGSASSENVKTNFDMSSNDWPEEGAGQPKQYRAGFMAADLCTYGKNALGGDDANVGVDTKFVLKSAHDKKHGSAMESQLFGYEMIAAGNKFIAEISGEKSDVDEAVGYLLGEKYIGRSKWTEFGGVKITKVDLTSANNAMPKDIKNGFSLWATSDLYFFDKIGQPSLSPTPKQFGIQNAEIDWKKSYIWKREFTPFNGVLHATEVSRYGIGAGSVIRFRPKNGEAISVGENVFNEGVGSFLESGAGQVRFMPQSSAKALSVLTNHTNIKTGANKSELLKLLLAKQSVAKIKLESQEFAKGDLVIKFKSSYSRANKANRPSNSQWGRVIDAIRHTKASDLEDNLFENANANANANPICAEKKWGKFSAEFKAIYDEIIKEELDLQLIVKGLAEDLRQIGGEHA